MAPSTAHRQKRPYQPSITSYFARSDRDLSDCGHSRAPPAHPVLEPSVQSDLLSVGMRIRKAVPEGYKTHKTALFYDPTPARAYSTLATSTISPRPTELLPFCGLHKVGGYSIQPKPEPVDPHASLNILDDSTSPCPLSQESTLSTISTDSMPAAPLLNPLTSNKRRYADDEDEDEDIPPFQLHFSDPVDPNLLVDLSVSPTKSGYPFSHTAMPDLTAISSRVVAKPKSRRKGTAPVAEDVILNDLDFEDAAFLAPWEGLEVEMGGT